MALSSDVTRQAIEDRLDAAHNLNYSADSFYEPDKYPQLDAEGKKIPGMLSSQEASPLNLNIGPASSRGAIQKRADAQFFNPEEVLNKRKLRYIQNTQNEVNRAKSLALGQYRLDNAAMNAEMQRNAQEAAQRSSLMGSILGVIGMVGGGMVAGPAGAAAGGAAGQGAGQATVSNKTGIQGGY